MTHSPSDIVAQLLINLGLVTNPTLVQSWPVFVGNEPTDPDNTITVFDYDGPNHGRTQPDGTMQGPQGIQIRVRSKIHTVGWTKADTICDRIQARTGGCYKVDVTINGTRYHLHSFCNISQVIPIGKESPTSTRRVFVINCGVTIDQCN